MQIKKQNGNALYFTIVIMLILMMVGLSLASFVIGEFKISRDIGKFTQAIYAADGGIERALYRTRRTADCPVVLGGPSCQIPLTALSNNTQYSAIVYDRLQVSWCPASVLNKCIRGFGSLLDTNRAFEVSF